MKETNEDYGSDEDQSINTETITTDSPTIDDDKDDEMDDDRIVTRQSPRKKTRLSSNKTNALPSPRRRSNRKIINQTKSRITSMCKFAFS